MMMVRRHALWIVALGAVAMLTWPSAPTRLWLVYNPSASAPRGWYRVTSEEPIRVGDYVLAHLPPQAAQLAADRGYLPASVPILKRVGAVGAQDVCSRAQSVLIDGTVVAHRLRRDRTGRDLPAWTSCRRLTSDELFLLSDTNPASFDSRYFGPVRRCDVIGKVVPVWIW